MLVSMACFWHCGSLLNMCRQLLLPLDWGEGKGVDWTCGTMGTSFQLPMYKISCELFLDDVFCLLGFDNYLIPTLFFSAGVMQSFFR